MGMKNEKRKRKIKFRLFWSQFWSCRSDVHQPSDQAAVVRCLAPLNDFWFHFNYLLKSSQPISDFVVVFIAFLVVHLFILCTNFLSFAFLLWATVVVSRPRQTWLPYRMHNYLFFCLAKHLIIFCVLFVYIRHPRTALDSSEKKKFCQPFAAFFSLWQTTNKQFFLYLFIFHISHIFGLASCEVKESL